MVLEANNESGGNPEFQFTVDYNLYSYHPCVILSFIVSPRDKSSDHPVYNREHEGSENVAVLTKIIFWMS